MLFSMIFSIIALCINFFILGCMVGKKSSKDEEVKK